MRYFPTCGCPERFYIVQEAHHRPNPKGKGYAVEGFILERVRKMTSGAQRRRERQRERRINIMSTDTAVTQITDGDESN